MLWFYECESLVMLGFMKRQVFGNIDRERKSRHDRKGVEEQRKICLCVYMAGLVEQNLALFFIPKRFFFLRFFKQTFFNCDYHVSEKKNEKNGEYHIFSRCVKYNKSYSEEPVK